MLCELAHLQKLPKYFWSQIYQLQGEPGTIACFGLIFVWFFAGEGVFFTTFACFVLLGFFLEGVQRRMLN